MTLKKYAKGVNKSEGQELKKFNVAKLAAEPTDEQTVAVNVEQTSLDEYMRQTFGCDATDVADFPTDEPSLTITFEVASND